MWEKIKNIFGSIASATPATIVRTIVMLISLINMVCAVMGWTPIDIDEDAIYQIVSSIAAVLTTIWAWWKNNSFTAEAQEADAVCAELKNAKHAKTIK